MNQVLVLGMFRSGTTLVSRLLGGHPACRIVSDPYLYFFKAYRDFLASEIGFPVNPEAPTPHFAFGKQRQLLEVMESAALAERMPATLQQRIRRDILRWKSRQHPQICSRLGEVSGDTFREFYQGLIELAVDVYGAEGITVAGTKVSWSEEFLPAMARAFPDMKFVFVVRDLRAVVASQEHQSGEGQGKRPLLFYARHWRKSVSLGNPAWYSPEVASRIQMVRYEDLVEQPREELERLCGHLGLDQPQQIDIDNLTGLDEQEDWRGNSSFGAGQGVFTESVDRWKNLLTRPQIAAIDALAGPELTALGYEVEHPVSDPLDFASAACEPSFSEVASWLQPFEDAAYLNDLEHREEEYREESHRRSLLEETMDPDPQEVRACFFRPSVYEGLRESWSGVLLGR